MKPITVFHSDGQIVRHLLDTDLPDFDSYSPLVASLLLIELLTLGAEIEISGWGDVVVVLYLPCLPRLETRMSGNLEDIAMLRNVCRLHGEGADLDLVRHFLLEDKTQAGNYYFCQGFRQLL